MAKLYTSLLNDVVSLPKVYENAKHVYHLYVISLKNRDKLLKTLADNQIFAGIHYPNPLHLLTAHKSLGYKNGDFPNTEKYAKTILSLPIFPGMTENEVRKVSKVITDAFLTHGN